MQLIFDTLMSKREDILISILRLILTLIAKSETFTKAIAEKNSNQAVKALLSILLGP